MSGSLQKIFSKKKMATLRRESERGHFWAGDRVFALQFQDSYFDMSLSQQVLSMIAGCK